MRQHDRQKQLTPKNTRGDPVCAGIPGPRFLAPECVPLLVEDRLQVALPAVAQHEAPVRTLVAADFSIGGEPIPLAVGNALDQPPQPAQVVGHLSGVVVVERHPRATGPPPRGARGCGNPPAAGRSAATPHSACTRRSPQRSAEARCPLIAPDGPRQQASRLRWCSRG